MPLVIGIARRSRREGELHLHRQRAGDLPVPQRHPAGPAGGHGAVRGHDRPARGLRSRRRPHAYAIRPRPTTWSTCSCRARSTHDPRQVQYGNYQMDTTGFFPTYWFLNGRAAPDTMFAPYASWLPTQPYNCMPMMEPGQRLLMRVVNAGRDLHPFHQHGNHAQVIARDGRLLDFDAAYPGRRPGLRGVHLPVRPGPDHGRHLHLDRRGDRSGTSTGTLPAILAQAQRVRRGPRQAFPGAAARAAGPHLRRLLERQPLPGKHGRAASGGRRDEPDSGLRVHVAQPHGKGNGQQRHLPRRDDDHVDHGAPGCEGC